MPSDVERATEILRGATRLVVLSGAGASTESGVPDFRGSGAGSIWSRFDPSDFEFSRFERDPKGFWELRARLMDALALDKVKPNPAHEALARASREPRFRGHVTQNIDGLFQAAGHDEEKLVEIHGSARKVRCIKCFRFFPYEVAERAMASGLVPPPCPECGGAAPQRGTDASAGASSVLKPGTILFGEMLHEPDLRRAERWTMEADAVLVVGSSLVVQPVGALPAIAAARGAALVMVNRSSTPYDERADVLVREPAGAVLPSILAGSKFI